jgi:murein DD-endopeptidase MepM/ murein hydrolase activator NlpD
LAPRRLIAHALAALAVVVLPAVAAAGLDDRQEELESRITALRDAISSAKNKEGVLSSEIRSASADIGSLEGRIDVLNGVVAELQAELDSSRARLAALEEKLAAQTERLEYLVEQHALAQEQLEERLVELYETETTSTIEIVLQVGSLTELLDQIDYFTALGRQDQEIAGHLEELRNEMRIARRETAETRKQVAAATAELETKTAEQAAARDALVAEQNALAAAREQKQSLLANVKEERHEHEEDLEAMQEASAAVAAQIQAAHAAAESSGSNGSGGSGSGGSGSSGGGGGTPSSSGFIWPCSGVLTSGFGWRWGRMHEGIDIAAPAGTPIHAVASGTIIFAGWMGGYGNMVIIDHGGGIATAYAHMSSIWVGGGSVGQGTSIGGVGTTGSSTGNHLHFEVRVNGQAVDPMGYL